LCGSLREIGQTDIRDILLFMIEYPELMNRKPGSTHASKKMYVDQVDWL
jgi:hypothetical protein